MDLIVDRQFELTFNDKTYLFAFVLEQSVGVAARLNYNKKAFQEPSFGGRNQNFSHHSFTARGLSVTDRPALVGTHNRPGGNGIAA